MVLWAASGIDRKPVVVVDHSPLLLEEKGMANYEQ